MVAPRSPFPVQPPDWPAPKGYSNAWQVPAGRDLLFLAGQIGWDEREQLVDGGFVPQFRKALENVRTLVETAGGRPEDVVRMTIFVADREPYLADLPGVGAAYRDVFGRHFPCMSLVEVAALLEPGALVEVEATAALDPNPET